MRVLLVSPGFHGYHSAIAAALGARGHDVTTEVYDDHGGVAGRAWHQLRHQLPHRLGAGELRRLAREESLAAATAVRQARPDPVATYSTRDDAAFRASGVDSRHLPLAYDHRLVPTPAQQRIPDVTFVGARYATRERVLLALQERGIRVRAHGRDWSGHPVDRLRTWRVSTPAVPAGRDLSRARAYDLMAASVATLNLHGDQDGFTMRTFEAAGVGAVELVDRGDVADLYEPGVEVLPWTTPDELADLCRRAASDTTWSDAVRAAARRRTLAEHTFDHRAAVLEGAWDTA